VVVQEANRFPYAIGHKSKYLVSRSAWEWQLGAAIRGRA
jgi:hypothetical protein